MVSVEYVIDSGTYMPVWLIVTLVAIGLVGIAIFCVGRWIMGSETVTIVGAVIAVVGLAAAYFGAIALSYRDFPDSEVAKVSAELSEESCTEITETDVILMDDNSRGLKFGYDKIERNGKTYFVVEGKC